MLLDFVKFARAKGLSERRIVSVHVLKNIMIPIVTVVGVEFGGLIAFAIVTETIFAWPGMGKLLIDSITRLDRPVVVAYLLVVVTLFIVINFVVDILYSLLDPRIRLGSARMTAISLPRLNAGQPRRPRAARDPGRAPRRRSRGVMLHPVAGDRRASVPGSRRRTPTT